MEKNNYFIFGTVNLVQNFVSKLVHFKICELNFELVHRKWTFPTLQTTMHTTWKAISKKKQKNNGEV